MINIHGGPMQEGGVPDLVICWRGHFAGWELKVPGKKPTDIQEYHLDQIGMAGGSAFVITSLADAAKALAVMETRG